MSRKDTIVPELMLEEDKMSTRNMLESQIAARIDKRRSSTIFTVGQDERPRDQQFETVQIIAGVHNQLANLYNIYFDPELPGIFASQVEFDEFESTGLDALSEDQMQTALHVLAGEDQGEENYRHLLNLARERIAEAERTDNLGDYLSWSYSAQLLDHRAKLNMVTSSIYAFVKGVPDTQVADFQSAREAEKAKFGAEAKVVKRLVGMVKALPDEKIKVAIARLPKEVDTTRPQRVLAYFPQHSISRWGNTPESTNPDAMLSYCITTAACIQHSFDNLYRLTRVRKSNGDFASRAFYVTAQQVEGETDKVDFSGAPNEFLEISFSDDSTQFPPLRTDITQQYPEFTFKERTELLRDDVERKIVTDGSVQHFVLGVGEHGEKITQDLIPYVMDSLMGGVSNAYLIRVDQFFK